jgi:hypothetical protein
MIDEGEPLELCAPAGVESTEILTARVRAVEEYHARVWCAVVR